MRGTYAFKVYLSIDYNYDNTGSDDDFMDDENHICFGNDTTEKRDTIIVE